MKRWTIGVDPGQQGGFTILNSNGGCHIYPIPLVDKEVDLEWLMLRCNTFRKYGDWREWHAWIEKVQAFPGALKPIECPRCKLVNLHRQPQGVVSTGTFMRGAGLIEGCFVGMGIACTRIAAKDWQKIMLGYYSAFGMGEPRTGKCPPRGRAALKAASIAEAQRRFPSATFKRTARCRTYSDGMADSALIAVYGSRITLV